MKQILHLFAGTSNRLVDAPQKLNYRIEILSGLTVALALIPEAIAFALIAQVSPLTGLYAAFVVGIITAIFGGRPGMISGATGAVAVVLVAVSIKYGIEYLFATVVLAGILQIIASLLKISRLMALVSYPVMLGFVNGLAIVILNSQFTHFKAADGSWMVGTSFYIMLALAFLTMLIIYFLPKLTKLIPGALFAIITVFLLTLIFNIDTKTVGDLASINGGFPPFHIPNIEFSLKTLEIILPPALIMASVGFIESLLTLNIIDNITQTKGRSNKEILSQGMGNIASGFFSGMGGCAMIGQSLINISSGARARLSAIVAALMLLIFIMFGSSLVEMIPIAALVGVMFMVALGTFEWASFKALGKMPKSDIFVIVAVTLITIFLHNLALAVLIGVILGALVFAWDNATRIRARKITDAEGIKNYQIHGPLFFGSVLSFTTKFDPKNDPEEIIINFAESRVVDMSAIEALDKLTSSYARLGKKVHLKHLSHDCIRLLKNAAAMIEVNVIEDPSYKVIDDT